MRLDETAERRERSTQKKNMDSGDSTFAMFASKFQNKRSEGRKLFKICPKKIEFAPNLPGIYPKRERDSKSVLQMHVNVKFITNLSGNRWIFSEYIIHAEILPVFTRKTTVKNHGRHA